MFNSQEAASRAWPGLADAIAAGRIPGAVLGVIDAQGTRCLRHGGHAALLPETVPMRAETVFDLASLTKPIFTTTTILQLVDRGLADLDAPLAAAIPDLRQYDVAGAPERRLTLRDCLAHRTHLPAVEPLYTYGQAPPTLRAFILQRAWTPGPPVYSDINFLLAGIAIERITGRPLADGTLPSGFTFHPAPPDCAATEFCRWRGRMLRGEVHDENAFAMGGAAGHAGLFGSADAVLDFAGGLLNGTVLPPALTALLRQVVHADRTIGWQAAAGGIIFHTGFTGTALWIDWTRRCAWTLLTNRVHPSRHTDSGIQALRRAVTEAMLTV
jgi:CubicO group peptidase (beta-lactamase class C family)